MRVLAADTLAATGHAAEARDHYAAAVRLEPDLPASHQGLGAALAAGGAHAAGQERATRKREDDIATQSWLAGRA